MLFQVGWGRTRWLYQFHLVDVLFLFAVVAGQNAVLHVEVRLHGFVVGDAFRIVALDDAFDVLGWYDGLLLLHLEVLDDVEDDVGRNDGES